MRRLLFLLAGLALLAGMGRFVAQQPAADPYQITEKSGKWFICVASYTDPAPVDGVELPPSASAAEMARDLAQEVRSKYKTPAYVYNRGAEERAKRRAEIQKLWEKCPEGRFRTVRIREQFAVLVGGYADQAVARKELDRVRQWPMPSDRFCGESGRIVEGKNDKGEKGWLVQQIRFSPFTKAFVVPNPLAPPDTTLDNKTDPFIIKINAGEDYSLFQCKRPWTLAIAVFQSPPTIKGSSGSSSFLDKLTGRDPGEQLAASALNAHNLAEVLRKLGHEAYVLHTRNNSTVTVGAFDSKDDRRMPQLAEAISRQLDKLDPRIRSQEASQSGNVILARPLPMEVPKS